MAEFSVCTLVNAPLADGHVNAYFFPNDFETIFGKKMKNSKNIKRYLCISKGSKKVYKLFRGMNLVPQGMIALDYESQCVLNVSDGESVNVFPVCKLRYHWHTLDSFGQIGFCISIIALVLTVISLLL